MSNDPWNVSRPVQPFEPVPPVQKGGVSRTGEHPRTVLDTVRDWLELYVTVVAESDLDILTLWAAHTHLCMETYTSPRLVIDSPVPGSGKTTVLEHLERLCARPIQMASLTSPALLTRMLDVEMRTILIDEADRSLSPKKDGVEELLAVLNSGYKRGGTRPVLVPAKGGSWDVAEMPTFSPVAMAGNSPDLPEDTKSRSIRVLLMPDIDGTADESDWEVIDSQARDIGEQLLQWADYVRDDVRLNRPTMPEGVKGRARERWSPLKRVAVAAGGRWSDIVDQLATEDVARIAAEKDEGIAQERPHMSLIAHIHQVWEPSETYIPTEELIDRLVSAHAGTWAEMSSYGRRLTSQRLGRMLVRHFKIHTTGRTPTGLAATPEQASLQHSAG